MLSSIKKIKLFFLQRQYRKIFNNSSVIIQPGFGIQSRGVDIKSSVWLGRDLILGCQIVFERNKGYVSIGDYSHVGASQLICAERIEIENNVMISWGCTLLDHSSHSLSYYDRFRDIRDWRKGLSEGGFERASLMKNWNSVRTGPIKICNGAWIGMNVIIMPGVTIGEGAVVSAGSVVTRNVDPWTLVRGNPARAIMRIDEIHEEMI